MIGGGYFMPFNKEITGYKNEEEFANYLNNKKVGRVNPIFQDLLFAIYGYLDFNDIIYSWVNYSKKKADIYVKINGYVRGISIKKGVKNSVHAEDINMFIKFLKENNISKKVIKEILRYHYADGTISGNGKYRISSEEYKLKDQKWIDFINENLNRGDLLDKAINRFVLQGNNSDYEINAIIYGVLDDFIWITRDEVKYILKKNRNIYSTAIHFSGLTVQPLARNLNYNPKYEKDRNKIQVKWYNISDDIIEVMATYRNGRTFLN